MITKIENKLIKYCQYCGGKLDKNANFCGNCGEKILYNKKENYDSLQNEPEKQSIRKVVYDGNVHKCPNCGETINSFTTHCPSCQLEMRGIETSKSIRDFAMQLSSLKSNGMQTSNSKKSFVSMLYGSEGSLTELDSQRLILIESYPIPNSIEDLLEFMILASSNINFKLYGMGDQGRFTATRKEISDAWISKMEQVYKKSKMIPDQSAHKKEIEKIYLNTISKVKKTKVVTVLLLIGAYIGVLLLIGIMYGFMINPVLTIIFLVILLIIASFCAYIFFKNRRSI